MNLKLTLEALQALDAIDRRGSFAAAATELHRVPSALTYVVQRLEEDLELLVFDRRGHRAKLTPAGRELLDEGRHLLRAAGELECRVRRVATGWETELRIAVDALLPFAALLGVVGEFYAQESGTRLRFSTEVLGGGWDALADNRADLIIGGTGEMPSGGGFATAHLGAVDFDFVVAPGHPLAAVSEPLARAQILRHRAVAVADTSRRLPGRTVGLLSGQDVLTVPDAEAKLAAHVAGLGVGYLPRALARHEAAAGRLLIRQVEEARPRADFQLAWRPDNPGRALKWFIRRLEDPAVLTALLQPDGGTTPVPRRRPSPARG